MKSHRVGAAVVLCSLAVAVLASCATTKGTTLGTVISAQGASGQNAAPPSTTVQQPSPNPLVSKQGLEIVSDPDRAEVWIDGAFKGLTPYIASDISTGFHKVTLRKSGYYEASSWVDFEASYMLYQANLVQITGFLQLSLTPPNAAVTVGGQTMTPGLLQLPVGSYAVVARCFGYDDFRQTVAITDKTTTSLAIELSPAQFAITSFSIPKQGVNPENPGLLGFLEAKFSVTAPGTGRVDVLDKNAKVLFTQALPDFTTWEQSISWNVRDSMGHALPDGSYTLSVTAHGSDMSVEVAKMLPFTVDRTLRVAPRSVWSGSAGLAYAPVAEVLPEGDFQISVLGAGIAVSDPPLFQAPIQLSARFGMGSSFEIDASADVIASSVATPVGAGLAARWNFTTPHGDYGTAAAVQAKLSFQYNPGPTTGQVLITDTFANFTGISVELPFQLRLGPVNLMLSAGATGSLWYPYRVDSSGAPVQSPVSWLYLRAGAMLDTGSVVAGISASTRTEPLPGGVAFLASPVPFQIGAEVHWLIPKTRLIVSALMAGEYQDNADYYVMGGGGLGFLY